MSFALSLIAPTNRTAAPTKSEKLLTSTYPLPLEWATILPFGGETVTEDTAPAPPAGRGDQHEASKETRVPDIYVDADACPVKEEVLRVAKRHGMTVHLVSNRWHRGPDDPLVNRVVVPEGPDAADDWIAARIGLGDIAITADIPLAARCLDRKALVLSPTGKAFTDASIGMALAMRDLNAHLRETGEMAGGPSSFSRRDRSQFLEALEQAARSARRMAGAPGNITPGAGRGSAS